MAKIISLAHEERYKVVRKEYYHPGSGVERDVYIFSSDNDILQLEDYENDDITVELLKEGYKCRIIRTLLLTIDKATVDNFVRTMKYPKEEMPLLVDTLLEKFEHRVLTAYL